jgi:hypothetical protein
VRQGLHFLRAELPGILAKRTDVLSPRMLHVIEDLAGDWCRLDERIDALSDEIMTLARQDKGCERLMTVPGIGPIISSAMVAAIGSGDAFSKGRDFGVWLGLVPKQMSTGDRTILGSISRRGSCSFRPPGSCWSRSSQRDGSATGSNRGSKGEATSDNGEAALQLALDGVGVARLADVIVGEAIRRGQLVQLLANAHKRELVPLSAVYVPGRHRLPKVSVFLDFLAERFGSAPWRR